MHSVNERKSPAPLIGAAVLALLATTNACAPSGHEDPPRAESTSIEVESERATTRPADFDLEYGALTELLRRRVAKGMVDYSKLKESDRAALASVFATLRSVDEKTYSKWTDAVRIAFWINLYNVATLDLMVRHWPVASINEIGETSGAAFKERFIDMSAMRRGTLSLDDVENAILRRDFKEARIHFALVCASKSCPDLRSEAWRGADLEKHLDAATRRFLGDPTKNRFDVAAKSFEVSSLFDWFRGDFAAAAGSEKEFIARHVDSDTADALRKSDGPLRFLDYDWSVNGR